MKFKVFAFALLAFVFSTPLFAKNITNGVLNFNMAESGKKYIPLNGDWEFYSNQTFTTLMGAQLRVDFIEVPASWTKKSQNNVSFPSMGCHTYRIMITGLRPNYEYALFSRHSPNYSAMIYGNGHFVAEYGKFSRHKNNYKPTLTPIYCRLISNESGSIELVIQVSNWTGSRGGIVAPIFFGEDIVISSLFRRIMIITASILGGLVFIIFINLFFWVFDKSKLTHLYFAALLTFLVLRFGFQNFNIFGLFGIVIPFGLQYKLQSFAIFSGGVFIYLYGNDKMFYAKHPLIDKTLAALTAGLFIVFICMPEGISMAVLNASIIWAGILALYSLYRMFFSIQKKQPITLAYTIFYMMIAFPIITDYYTVNPWSDSHLYISEISTVLMIIFDIVYIAAIMEVLQKKSLRLKSESSKYHFSVRRFVPHNLSRLVERSAFNSLEHGTNIEDTFTIMFIGFQVISPDNTQINLRDNFEARGFYSATIIDMLEQNNGAVISISSQGISALFKGNAPDAIEAAYKIRNILQTINARRAEDYYPCITFNISIHQGDLLLGIVGDRNRIDFTIISSSIEVIDKMCNLGFAMNIPTLVSEPMVKALGDKCPRKLKLLGRIHFSEFTRPIGLYGFISSEEEETSLEDLDDAPFITQFNADKYINF